MKSAALNILFVVMPILSGIFLGLVCYIQPDAWVFELLAFAVPLVIVLNLMLFLSSLFWFRKPAYLILPFLSFALIYKPFFETLGCRLGMADNEAGFTVMSYNVATFNPSRMENKQSDSLMSSSFYHWLRETNTPDILCLQEFYHSDLADFDNALDSILTIGEYTYFYMNPVYKDEHNGVFAVITFSKFKSIKSGSLVYGDHYLNKGVFHDFVIGSDTLRIVNFQLNSMSIRWAWPDTLSLPQKLAHNATNIYQRLQSGYEKRHEELNEIEAFLDESPYPVILCADINAIPYSRTYQRLKKKYANAFEQEGCGLGYTLNRFPYYVRIDNQFYDPKLKLNYFKTHTGMKVSDHFPIEAGYSF